MATWTETIAEARRIPRSARVAQGFTRIRDFAAHVWRVRHERAQRRKSGGTDSLDALRDTIAERLQAILDERPEIRRSARQTARLDCHDSAPCVVAYYRTWREPEVEGQRYRKYHWQNGGANGTVYHPSTRHVVVPAAWLLRAMREHT